MCAQVNIIQPSFLEVIPAACHPRPNSFRAFAALVLLAAAPSRVNPYQIHNSSQRPRRLFLLARGRAGARGRVCRIVLLDVI